MIRFRFTPEAAADLFDIWSYIAGDDPEAADRVEEAIYRASMFIGEGPLRGQIRRDLTHRPLRFWTVQPFPNYVTSTILRRRRFRLFGLCMACGI